MPRGFPEAPEVGPEEEKISRKDAKAQRKEDLNRRARIPSEHGQAILKYLLQTTDRVQRSNTATQSKTAWVP